MTPEDRTAAADLLSQVVSALQERAWPGDDVLVDQLRDRLAAVPHVDLDQLASVLDGAEGGLLDLQDGGVLPPDHAEEAGLELDDEHTVHVPGLGSGAAWRDRWSYVETLPGGPDVSDSPPRCRAAGRSDASPSSSSCLSSSRAKRQAGGARRAVPGLGGRQGGRPGA